MSTAAVICCHKRAVCRQLLFSRWLLLASWRLARSTSAAGVRWLSLFRAFHCPAFAHPTFASNQLLRWDVGKRCCDCSAVPLCRAKSCYCFLLQVGRGWQTLLRFPVGLLGGQPGALPPQGKRCYGHMQSVMRLNASSSP